ncbi:uncharacterized protein BDW70DRAFT_156920 [Aspergillus foveolatus]|uniref:uncharacterized protein n=1 Tax=Aspergillus foveolatus TaxID=210207 RepID=UPI003CCD7A71
MAARPQTVKKSKRDRKKSWKKDPWKGKVADLSYSPYRKAKMEGKLPGPNPAEHVCPSVPTSTHVARAAQRMKYWPERQRLSPIQSPELDAPILVEGKELGLPELNREAKPALNPIDGIPPTRFPRVYLGDNAPTPRWLIRPVGPVTSPESAHNLSSDSGYVSASSGYSSASGSSRHPPLGRLRWEFDPGPAAKHGQDETRLHEYAYRYLQNSLRDPIVREEMSNMIWNSPYAPVVANVEDPLPIPPPPPHFRDQRPSDYVTLREPISASSPDDYHFKYPDYARPSLAVRTYGHQDTHTSRKSSVNSQSSANSHGSSSTGESSRTRASTSSSISIVHKEFSPVYQHEFDDDTNHYLKRGEYKWIWIVLTILILALFLCLFLYAFGILQ